MTVLRKLVWLIVICLAGCGYQSRPYQNDITTVAVPIFDNKTTWREMEFDLTNLVHREIKTRTPFRLVSKPEDADIVIQGEIIDYHKPPLVSTIQDQALISASRITLRVTIKNQKTGKNILTQTNTVQSDFIQGAKETPADAEYRGRLNTFEQLSRWVVSLLEDL